MRHVTSKPAAQTQGLTRPRIRAMAADEAFKDITDGGELTKPPVPATIVATPKPLSRLYLELLHKYYKLKLDMQRLQSPSRTPEEIERQLAAIRRFFATLSDSEGAVTAANLYHREFFAGELDSKYRVALLTWLVTRFSHAEPLITGVYNFWTMLLEKESHSS